MNVHEELKFLGNSKKIGGGCRGVRRVGLGGVRVDVNEELNFLGKFKKKLGGGVGSGGQVGVGLVGGSGWM